MSINFLKKKIFIVATFVCLLAVGVNIETIRTFPSWFDEAFFANIAFNKSQGRGLVLDVIPQYFEGEIYLYGPIFFYLQSLLINIFGLQDVIFRLPNLLAAYLSIFLLSRVLKHNAVDLRYRILFILAAVLDVSINRNMVSGRMDMLAVMFVMLALYTVARPSSRTGWQAYFQWFLVGCFCAAAYLTTPRALFLLPVVFTLGLQRLYIERTSETSEKNWIILAILALMSFTLPIWLWIQHVGGLQYYVSLFTASPAASQHIAPSFFRSSYDNIAISLMIIMCLLNFHKISKNALLAGLILTYISFSLFVKEVGPYAAMIMPFVLATVVIFVANFTGKQPLRFVVLPLIIIPGVILIGLRGVDLFLNSECRNNTVALTVEQVIKDGKRIVAPFKYYFLLERPDRNLVTLEYSKISWADVVNNAEIVVADGAEKSKLRDNGFSEVARVACTLRRVPLLPSTFYGRSVFDEVVYRR